MKKFLLGLALAAGMAGSLSGCGAIGAITPVGNALGIASQAASPLQGLSDFQSNHGSFAACEGGYIQHYYADGTHSGHDFSKVRSCTRVEHLLREMFSEGYCTGAKARVNAGWADWLQTQITTPHQRGLTGGSDGMVIDGVPWEQYRYTTRFKGDSVCGYAENLIKLGGWVNYGLDPKIFGPGAAGPAFRAYFAKHPAEQQAYLTMQHETPQ